MKGSSLKLTLTSLTTITSFPAVDVPQQQQQHHHQQQQTSAIIATVERPASAPQQIPNQLVQQTHQPRVVIADYASTAVPSDTISASPHGSSSDGPDCECDADGVSGADSLKHADKSLSASSSPARPTNIPSSSPSAAPLAVDGSPPKEQQPQPKQQQQQPPQQPTPSSPRSSPRSCLRRAHSPPSPPQQQRPQLKQPQQSSSPQQRQQKQQQQLKKQLQQLPRGGPSSHSPSPASSSSSSSSSPRSSPSSSPTEEMRQPRVRSISCPQMDNSNSSNGMDHSQVLGDLEVLVRKKSAETFGERLEENEKTGKF